MDAADARTPQSDPPPDGEQLALAALALAFRLDAIEISRDGADIIDRLLVAAILDANLGPVKQDLSLQARYAGVDAPPPQTRLRPVSMNAVAQSLGLPFETVRRRANRLVQSGVCALTDQGLVASPDHLGSPEFKAMSLARYERLRRFHGDLMYRGGLPPMGDAAAPAIGDEPVRIANRILGEHLMRFIERAKGLVGDPLKTLVLLHMARLNLADSDIRNLDPVDLVTIARPVTNKRLGDLLRISDETVRRRTVELERDGFCRRTRTGFVAAFDALERRRLAGLVSQSASEVRRLFSDLHRLGVLAAWEAEPDRALGDQTAAKPAPSARNP